MLAGGAAWMLRFFHFGFDMGDEAVALLGGWRIATGEVPHRDFVENVPPFSFLPTALVFRLFGPTLVASRALSLVYGLLLILGADGLLLRLGAGLLARCTVAAFLIPFGVFHWPMPSHHWVADLLQLYSAWALIAAVDAKRARLLAGASGLFAGLAVFTLQDQGAYFVLVLLVAMFAGLKDRARRLRLIGSWCLGGASAVTAFAIYLLPRVPISELWQQWGAFHLSRYADAPGNQGGLLRGWELVAQYFAPGALAAHPIGNGSMLLMTVFLTALPFVALASLVVGWVRVPGLRLPVGILVALGLAHMGACLHRWALLNIVWAAPPLIVAVTWALDRVPRSASRGFSRAALASLLGVELAFSAARIATPIPTARLEARAGVLVSDRLKDVRVTAASLEAIEANVPIGAPLFCNGYFSLFNFLTLRPNPTRFNIFVHPDYHSDEQAREVVASLEVRPEAFVLTALPLRGTIVDRFIASRYRPVWVMPYAALYARR